MDPLARRLALQLALLATLLLAAAGASPLLAGAIALYQSTLSRAWDRPCPHARLPGGESCSAYARARIAEAGALAGMALARERFRACGRAAREAREHGSREARAAEGKESRP